MAVIIEAVEIFPFYPRLKAAHRPVDMYGIDHRDAFKVTAAGGHVGWGESRPRPWAHVEPTKYDHLVGRNASELLLSNEIEDVGLLTALYDLVATHLGVPVHKLLGQKVRDWVPCAAWTRPCTPAEFRSEIQRAADEGYMTFKIHTSAIFDVFEQVRMAEEVAPPGFRIHFVSQRLFIPQHHCW